MTHQYLHQYPRTPAIKLVLDAFGVKRDPGYNLKEAHCAIYLAERAGVHVGAYEFYNFMGSPSAEELIGEVNALNIMLHQGVDDFGTKELSADALAKIDSIRDLVIPPEELRERLDLADETLKRKSALWPMITAQIHFQERWFGVPDLSAYMMHGEGMVHLKTAAYEKLVHFPNVDYDEMSRAQDQTYREIEDEPEENMQPNM